MLHQSTSCHRYARVVSHINDSKGMPHTDNTREHLVESQIRIHCSTPQQTTTQMVLEKSFLESQIRFLNLPPSLLGAHTGMKCNQHTIHKADHIATHTATHTATHGICRHLSANAGYSYDGSFMALLLKKKTTPHINEPCHTYDRGMAYI